MAAALSLWLRDGGNAPQFVFQLLIYPWLQSFDLNLPSMHLNERVPYDIITKEGMAKSTLTYLNESLEYTSELMTNSHTTPNMRQRYSSLVDWNLIPKHMVPKSYTRPRNQGNIKLAEKLEEDMTNPYIFPLMADDLSDLPPAFVWTVESDCLRDEGIIFAKRMEKDGGIVEHYHDLHGWHGMISFLEGPLKMDAGVKGTDAIVQFADAHYKDN